jgi:hypothetical protein
LKAKQETRADFRARDHETQAHELWQGRCVGVQSLLLTT